jgi:hypothetical protein
LDSRLIDSLSPEAIALRINETLNRAPPRRDHAALLEELLEGFRQDHGAHPDNDIPPVGETVPGADPDEVGSAED